jgi:glyoxylase-like metal-dependent hydrolase (beta-lactamase superfamily II)
MSPLPGIHRMTNGVSNFYAVEEEGAWVLVDAGVRGDWAGLLRELSTHGRRPEDLKAILLTHAHSDHTGFAERARLELGTSVWVHAADLAVARGGAPAANEGRLRGYLRHAEAWRTLLILLARGGARVVPVLEVASFVDGQRLDVPGRPSVVHLPGHTRGMAALHFESRRALFTGDALVTRNPLTGRTGPQIMPRALNWNSRQALDSLDRLGAVAADLVLPGHGEPWTGGAAEAVHRARLAGLS